MPGSLLLVRHGRPRAVRGEPATTWSLDPTAYADVRALRDRLPGPGEAAWWTSPEPKALQTARLLEADDLHVEPDLAEHRRGGAWVDDLPATVRRAFERPDEPAHPGWEPLADCRDRVARAARRLLAATTGDLVLVGHGTAWTALVAALTRTPPDLDRWQALAMPDLLVLPRGSLVP